MTSIYANLLGNWVNLNDNPNSRVGTMGQSPYLWWEEGAEIWSAKNMDVKGSLYQAPYVHIYYNGIEYRINPITHIQIVTTKE